MIYLLLQMRFIIIRVLLNSTTLHIHRLKSSVSYQLAKLEIGFVELNAENDRQDKCYVSDSIKH